MLRGNSRGHQTTVVALVVVLMGAACSSQTTAVTTTVATAGDPATTTTPPDETTIAPQGDTAPQTSADSAPPDVTVADDAANAQLRETDFGCDLFGWLQSFDGPQELTVALIDGELPSSKSAVTAAACQGWTTWHSELVLEGMEEWPRSLSVSTDTILRNGTADTREIIDLEGRTFEAISVGDMSYWRATGGEWYSIDFAGDDVAALGALTRFGDEFGALFTAGFLISFGLIGTLIYAPLAVEVGPDEVNGITTTHWRVTPEAAEEYAADQGASIPATAFGASSIDYWVTDAGGLAQIDLFFDEAAAISLGGQPGGAAHIRFEVSRVDEPLEITAP